MTAKTRRTMSIAAPFVVALAALTAPAHAATEPRHGASHCRGRALTHPPALFTRQARSLCHRVSS